MSVGHCRDHLRCLCLKLYQLALSQAWVAGFGFTLWVILWRVFSLMESVVAEQREVSALRAAAAPVSGGDDAAARKKN